MTTKKTKTLLELGNRIKEERKKRGITSEKLAYETGISKGNLSEIERSLRDVRISTLILIAEGLEISLSKMLKDLDL